MKIRFLGCRGSVPTPGSSYSEYGGNTSCLQVIDNSENYIILDAGSGLRRLQQHALKAKTKDTLILLSHFHWDHIMGIPFFAPFYIKDFSFKIYGPKESSEEMYNTLNKILSKDYFPVNFEQFQCKIDFDIFYEGKKIIFGDMIVEAIFVNHPCYTLSYKITSSGKTFIYMTDHEPYTRRLHATHPSLVNYHSAEILQARLIDFIRGSDILILDGEYTKAEYFNGHVGWGHSSLNDAIQLAIDSKVPYLVIHHHNQERTDEQLNSIHTKLSAFLRQQKIPLQIAFAKEGSYILL